MTTQFTKATLINMLRQAATKIEDEKQHLTQLDSVTGDGDHGVTILRSLKAVVATIDESGDQPLPDLLKAIAMKVMMCDGGSTSPLLGSYFLGLSSGASGDEMSAEQAAGMFEAGFSNFQKTSKANIGDKTMMDALAPATETLAMKLKGSGDITAAFKAAAKEACDGAEKTKAYVAKMGRARTMGERSVGHEDPGAVSISIIFSAFAESL